MLVCEKDDRNNVKARRWLACPLRTLRATPDSHSGDARGQQLLVCDVCGQPPEEQAHHQKLRVEDWLVGGVGKG